MRWAILALLAVLSPLRGQDDLVNERLPADRLALERHWGLDCSAAVDDVRALLGEAEAGSGVTLSPEREASIVQDLERCALLDRRADTASGRHHGLSGAFQRWRGASAGGREAERMAARCALSALLDTEFDLNQGR